MPEAYLPEVHEQIFFKLLPVGARAHVKLPLWGVGAGGSGPLSQLAKEDGGKSVPAMGFPPFHDTYFTSLRKGEIKGEIRPCYGLSAFYCTTFY